MNDQGRLDCYEITSFIQDSFCVGLESGDILKCDLEFVLNAPGEGETHQYVESKRIYNPMLTVGLSLSLSLSLSLTTITIGLLRDIVKALYPFFKFTWNKILTGFCYILFYYLENFVVWKKKLQMSKGNIVN